MKRTRHDRPSAHPYQSFSRVIAIVAALAVLVISIARASDYRYEPYQQPTSTVSGWGGTLAKQIAFGRGGVDLHLIGREWVAGENMNFARGVHYTYDNSSWSRHVFAPDPTGTWDENGRHSTDFRFVVDSNDDVHVVHEAKYYIDSTMVHIGYKTSADTASWNPANFPHLILLGVSPRMAIHESATDTTLHVVFSSADTSNATVSWATHAMRSLHDPISSWSVSYVTTQFYPSAAYGSVLVGGDGVVHIYGSDGGPCTGGQDKVFRMYHASGTPPSSGTWTLDTGPTEIDEFTQVDGCFTLPFAGEGSESQDDSAGSGDVFCLAWTRLEDPASMGAPQEQTIGVRVLDASTNPYTWYPPLTTEAFRLSAVGDSINSGQPTVAVDGSTFHVFWQDIVDGRRRLMHRFNSTPTDTTTWSPTMEVFPDLPGDAKRPTAVAASGTVHTVASGDTEGWYRTGSTFSGFSFSANTTTTASAGVYFLEGDLEVPSTSTLSLPEGTTLSFARAEDYVHAPAWGARR
ncbi:MAG: hypothetical protein R3B81_19805 [bacterium]